ncbi:Peptidase S26A signal peptidase I [Lasiodiplodia theobromae]|uniref:Peptidase S26A n=1 Tax=Lasiodiplodia theobromae TaxID=45133 RepID=UPI0015C359F7|nr:Peptidase S26A [Lasiodiplodia theobromae]KAF4533806.1 Peptidase S26A [Lasiodiplodia theobromae]KAF9638098.1 Peptidase S26A signal peptidase I [Lasiodiplodia theobromae]
MAAPFFSRLSRLRPWVPFVRKYTYYTAAGVAAIAFLHDHVYEVTGVEGESMAPTLSPRYHDAGELDQVFFNRLVPPQLLRRGDIISFRAPNRPEQVSIKRLVALPGDTVITRGRYPFKKVVVPYNHVWVEGDNWRRTVDSNDFGPLPMGLINGRAEYVVLPLSRMGKVSDLNVNFKTYSRVIPAKFPAQLPQEYAD